MQTVEDIIIRAAKQFADYDSSGDSDDDKYTRIKIADWLEYYLLALSWLVSVRPDSHYKSAAVTLTANSTRHSLPDEAVQLIDIPYNLGAAGTTPGLSISILDEEDLKASFSDWHTMTGEAAIQYFSYDLKKPKNVMTYPRAHATTVVQVLMEYSYHFTTVAIADIGATDIEAGEEFYGAIISQMLNLAFSVDLNSAPNQNLSLRHEQSAYQALGLQFRSKASIAPIAKEGKP